MPEDAPVGAGILTPGRDPERCSPTDVPRSAAAEAEADAHVGPLRQADRLIGLDRAARSIDAGSAVRQSLLAHPAAWSG